MKNSRLTPDLCIVGAGSAGLAIAAGAQQMGADCVLVERGKMGGDCLNYGCVPSKALLAAGRAARLGAAARAFGVTYDPPRVDFQAVHDHVHGVIDAIKPMDSQERFEGLGVTVLRGEASFVGPREVRVGEHSVRARRFVLATGSTAAVPPIPGLAETPYLTNETIFDLSERPEHLIVIGAGAIGSELGQAFAHLGAKVSLIEMARVLPHEDEELGECVRQSLRADGVDLHEGVAVSAVAAKGGGIEVTLEADGGERRLQGSHLLVAAGRRPVLDGLGLEAAGIERRDGALVVDRRLRTTNRRVFAAGDVGGGPMFTHVAGYHAGIVIKNALFRIPAKADHSAVPRVTYTTPELAQVGLSEAQARERGGAIHVLRWPFAENDRAQAERNTHGLIKAITDKRGKVLGCGIAGEHAGELIQPWILAMQKGMKVGDMAQTIVPYPTLGEVSKRAAGSYYTPKLFSERTRRIVRLLARLG
ncbi:dihydrolipoyl dehydrogenase family protein [Ferruginivarius sediminum]|uniref:Dihydrolipoamide dehydrogenase n=1 Tax=Ferruginivarius sediminum TaxID=2661937 RepID=A0A369T7M5_9PROT|nr:FAD-dependent oxidoreductase [Ferruginivarius sediminum]RDD60355.1 dihydrolipoamide dehydrogenase [Ferruginivarius sediminum]